MREKVEDLLIDNNRGLDAVNLIALLFSNARVRGDDSGVEPGSAVVVIKRPAVGFSIEDLISNTESTECILIWKSFQRRKSQFCFRYYPGVARDKDTLKAS